MTDDLVDVFGGLELEDVEEKDLQTTVPCNTLTASPAKTSEPGDMTCAICLSDIQLENLAMVKGCDHIYCVSCILHWTLHKETPWCPQCKQSFTHLFTYRALDGSLSDFPVEESVVLLKRARWFEESLRQHCANGEATHSLLEDSRLADDTAWQDYAEDYDLAEDDEIEAFYFSSAAGRARIVLGNRRFGEGGFVTGGRRQARPVNQTPTSGGKGKAKGKAKGKGKSPELASASSLSASLSASMPFRKQNQSKSTEKMKGLKMMMMDDDCETSNFFQSSPSCSYRDGNGLEGTSPPGSGRRAKRAARRASVTECQCQV